MKFRTALAAGAVAAAIIDSAAVANIRQQHTTLSRHPWLPGGTLAAHAAWAWVALTIVATAVIFAAGSVTARRRRPRVFPVRKPQG